MRNKAIALILAVLVLCLCACSPATPPTLDLVEPTDAEPSEQTAEPAPTPEPTPEATPEPTPEPAEVSFHLWQGGEAPALYTAVEREEFPQNTLYAFTDYLGVVRYRTPVLRVTVQGKDVLRETGYTEPVLDPEWVLPEDPVFLQPEDEKPGVCVPVEIDWEQWKTRNAYQAGENTGHVIYTGKDGETQSLVYASLGGEEAAFYPADDEGIMIPGSLPSGHDPLVPSYYPDGTPADGSILLVVYQGSQATAAYEGRDGQWEMIRLMACSTGRITPNGNFTLGERYRYRTLFGGKGQYAVRITGYFLFHSVPINPYARDLEKGQSQMFIDQYEGLGTMISRGCVRLTVEDAKWVYDNCPRGTAVRITRSAGPDCPEVPPIIHEAPYITGENMGWDPTDPNPENPYNMTEEEVAKLLAPDEGEGGEDKAEGEGAQD